MYLIYSFFLSSFFSFGSFLFFLLPDAFVDREKHLLMLLILAGDIEQVVE